MNYELLLASFAILPWLGLALVVSIKRPVALIAVTVLVLAVEGYRQIQFIPKAVVAGYDVYVTDVLTALLIAATATRIASMQHLRVPRAYVLLSTFVLLGFVLFIPRLGIGPAVGYYRSWLLGLSLFALAATLSPRERLATQHAVILSALAASVIQVYGFVRFGFGGATASVVVDGVVLNARPFNDHVGLLMLIGLLLAVSSTRISYRTKLLVVPWLAVSVFLAQHRSVWIGALLAASGALLLYLRNSRRSWRSIVTVQSVFVVSVLVLMLLSGQAWLRDSGSSSGTFTWRLALWRAKMSTARSPLEWLFGSALGPTPLNDGSHFSEAAIVSAHSTFVDYVTDVGYVGVICVVVLIVTAVKTSAVGLRLSIVAMLGYGFTYPWGNWMWLVIGLAVFTTSGREDSQGTGTLQQPPTSSDLMSRAISLRQESAPSDLIGGSYK